MKHAITKPCCQGAATQNAAAFGKKPPFKEAKKVYGPLPTAAISAGGARRDSPCLPLPVETQAERSKPQGAQPAATGQVSGLTIDTKGVAAVRREGSLAFREDRLMSTVTPDTCTMLFQSPSTENQDARKREDAASEQ
jgi:hypothetical protein